MNGYRAWVQTAIDAEDHAVALRAADIAADCGAEWIEAGLPIAYGLGYPGITELKNRVGDRAKIVADYKFPFAEPIIPKVAQAGADYITVEGCYYSDEKLCDIIRLGRENNIGIIFTLLSYHPKDLAARAKHLEDLGAEYVFIRAEIREEGVTYRCVPPVREATNLKIGATEDDLESAVHAVREGADWIVFGKVLLEPDERSCREWINAIHDAGNN